MPWLPTERFKYLRSWVSVHANAQCFFSSFPHRGPLLAREKRLLLSWFMVIATSHHASQAKNPTLEGMHWFQNILFVKGAASLSPARASKLDFTEKRPSFDNFHAILSTSRGLIKNIICVEFDILFLFVTSNLFNLFNSLI